MPKNRASGFRAWTCASLSSVTGDCFRTKRVRLKLTQQELGDLLGLTRNTVGTYEASPEVPKIAALAIKQLLREKRRHRNRC